MDPHSHVVHQTSSEITYVLTTALSRKIFDRSSQKPTDTTVKSTWTCLFGHFQTHHLQVGSMWAAIHFSPYLAHGTLWILIVTYLCHFDSHVAMMQRIMDILWRYLQNQAIVIKRLSSLFGYPLSPFQEKAMSTRSTVHRFHPFFFPAHPGLASMEQPTNRRDTCPSVWCFNDSISNIVGEEYLQAGIATFWTFGGLQLLSSSSYRWDLRPGVDDES